MTLQQELIKEAENEIKTDEYVAECRKLKEELKNNHEFWNLRPYLGYYNWAMFYLFIGGRMAGKSYAVSNFFIDQFVHKGIPFFWIRLTETQAKKLLENNAMRIADPDLIAKYNLQLQTVGNCIYAVKTSKKEIHHRDGSIDYKTVVEERKLMCKVYCASTFYNDKGSIYDKDFLKKFKSYNIAIDEFQRERNEKNNFDVTYALVNQLENLIRTEKQRVRIFFMGNCVEDSADILCAFNFIPETFGVFKLKNKRAVIVNIKPTQEYINRRTGSAANILLGDDPTFTNERKLDDSLVSVKRLQKPMYVIKFTTDPKTWFTVWDNNIIAPYKRENKRVIAMRPYLDELYDTEIKDNVMNLFDTRCFKYKNLITFKLFQKEMQLLRPKK